MASKANYDGRTQKGRASDGWALSDTLDTQGKNRAIVQALFTKPGMYTAQFGLGAVKGGVPLFKLNPVALVSWKLEGLIVTRKVSIVDGCSISGVAEACELKVWDDSLLLVGTNQNYVISCTMAPGTRAANSCPPLYRPIVSQPTLAPNIGRVFLAAGESFDVSIPRGIGAVTAYARAFTVAELVVPEAGDVAALLMSGGTVSAGWDAFYDGVLPQPLSVSQNLLTLYNHSTESMVYNIAFGIDG